MIIRYFTNISISDSHTHPSHSNCALTIIARRLADLPLPTEESSPPRPSPSHLHAAAFSPSAGVAAGAGGGGLTADKRSGSHIWQGGPVHDWTKEQVGGRGRTVGRGRERDGHRLWDLLRHDWTREQFGGGVERAEGMFWEV